MAYSSYAIERGGSFLHQLLDSRSEFQKDFLANSVNIKKFILKRYSIV